MAVLGGCKTDAYLSQCANLYSKIINWQRKTGFTPKIICDFQGLNKDLKANTKDLIVMDNLG